MAARFFGASNDSCNMEAAFFSKKVRAMQWFRDINLFYNALGAVERKCRSVWLYCSTHANAGVAYSISIREKGISLKKTTLITSTINSSSANALPLSLMFSRHIREV